MVVEGGLLYQFRKVKYLQCYTYSYLLPESFCTSENHFHSSQSKIKNNIDISLFIFLLININKIFILQIWSRISWIGDKIYVSYTYLKVARQQQTFDVFTANVN